MVKIDAVNDDATRRPCDLLIVIKPDADCASDKIIEKLGISLAIREGEYRFFKGSRSWATNVLFLGISPPSKVAAGDIRATAARSLEIASQADEVEVACLLISDALGGTKELRAIVAGIDDALAGDCPPNLQLIELLSSDIEICRRIQAALCEFKFANTERPESALEIRILRDDQEVVDRAKDIRQALERGDLFAAYSTIREAYQAGLERPDVHYFEVLVLSRMGDTEEARRRYDALGISADDSVDALALQARLLKDAAFEAANDERAGLLKAASEAYSNVFERKGGHFPLINAATLALLAGETELARYRAEAVLREKGVRIGNGYWSLASKAEAELVLGRHESARKTVAEAIRQEDASPGARSSTVRQFEHLSHLSGHRDEMDAVLALLRPAPVAHFCGHIFKPEPAAERAISSSIDAMLSDRGISIGYGALAAGADILFAERILARDGELHVVLPFEQTDFVTQSVLSAGSSWEARFHVCLAAAKSVTFASGMEYVGDDQQFIYGARVAMGMARLRADHLRTGALQLAVWDGKEDGSASGTAGNVALWNRIGGETLTITPVAVDRVHCRSTVREDRETRSTHAILFCDFAGFSRLSERVLPLFWREIMERSADILDRHGSIVLARNSWGDAIYAILQDTEGAAELALDLQCELKSADMSSLSSAGGGMRLALHYGPMYKTHDRILDRSNYYGREVSLAARLEPVTPPSSIYVTEPFAAVLATEAPRKYRTDYAGKIQFAKKHGTYPIYRLSRARSAE